MSLIPISNRYYTDSINLIKKVDIRGFLLGKDRENTFTGEGYKNLLEPEKNVNEIYKKIEIFLVDGLYNSKEIELLIGNLIVYLKKENTYQTNSLKNLLENSKEYSQSEHDKRNLEGIRTEWQKTIDCIELIKKNLINRITNSDLFEKEQKSAPSLNKIRYKLVYLLMNEFEMFDGEKYKKLTNVKKAKLLNLILGLEGDGIRQDLSKVNDFINEANNKIELERLVQEVNTAKIKKGRKL